MTNEEAIEVLKCCMTDDCDNCQMKAENVYRCAESSFAPAFVEVPKEMLLQVLEMAQAQQPRVLTLEEVRERKPFHLWAEDTETGAQVFQVAYVGGLYVDSAEDWSVDPDHRNTPEYYGKSWRFWDKKPTNEQRQATPWDEPPKEEENAD